MQGRGSGGSQAQQQLPMEQPWPQWRRRQEATQAPEEQQLPMEQRTQQLQQVPEDSSLMDCQGRPSRQVEEQAIQLRAPTEANATFEIWPLLDLERTSSEEDYEACD